MFQVAMVLALVSVAASIILLVTHHTVHWCGTSECREYHGDSSNLCEHLRGGEASANNVEVVASASTSWC